MARSYGRHTTSIWQDVDFTTLTQAQQCLYFTLGLQPDVTAAGLLSLTAGRWANLSVDATRELILTQLADLAAHDGRHLVVDQGTEEVLIRTFMKWDGGWKNSKRLPVVLDAVRAIASVHIRDAAVDELRKLALSDAVSADEKRARDAVSDALSGFDRKGQRLVVTEGDHSSLDLKPIPEPGAVAAGDVPPSMFCQEHPNGTTDACGGCARAREVYAAQAQSRIEDEVAAKRAAAQAVADCDDCNADGIREHPQSKMPLGRCGHPSLRVASVTAISAVADRG